MLHSLVFASERNGGLLTLFGVSQRRPWLLAFSYKRIKKKKKHSLFFFSLFSVKCTVAIFFPLHADGGLISSRLSDSDSILLQLLRGEVLLQVALVARQWQAVCDAGQEGHWPTVLLQLSGLLLHMHLVAGGESNQLLAGRIKRVIQVLLCAHSPATSSGTPAQRSTALP